MDDCDSRRGVHRCLRSAHLTPYTRPMIKQHNGAFLVNETAANDPICQQVMASYMEELRRETARRDRIRQGIEPQDMGQFEIWNISDRH